MNPEIAIENVIISSVGAFEGSIEIGWGTQQFNASFGPQVVDPIVMAEGLVSLERQMENFTIPLEASKEAIVEDVQQHFETESGPDGTPWAEWAESYAPVAERRNIGKLRRRDSEQLYEAATDRSSYDVVGNSLFINTHNFPIYWALQQYGGNIKTERNIIKRGTRSRAGTGYGRVPSRPYLGMSPTAQAAVGAVFDGWLGGMIIGFNPYSFRVGALQPRLKSGQFGKIGL